MENDCIAAGWNRIPFLFQSKNIHREAKSIIESVEPDAFEIPVGYTKID